MATYEEHCRRRGIPYTPPPTPPTPPPVPKRARKDDGKFEGDDPATPEVNEAWEGGKAPKKKAPAKKKAAPQKKKK